MEEKLKNIDKLFKDNLQDYKIEDSKLSWNKFSQLYQNSRFWQMGFKHFNVLYAGMIASFFGLSVASYLYKTKTEIVKQTVYDTIWVKEVTIENESARSFEEIDMQTKESLLNETEKSYTQSKNSVKKVSKVSEEEVAETVEVQEKNSQNEKVTQIKEAEASSEPLVAKTKIIKKVPITVKKQETITKFDTVTHKKANGFKNN
jgi:hypothetical protein